MQTAEVSSPPWQPTLPSISLIEFLIALTHNDGARTYRLLLAAFLYSSSSESSEIFKLFLLHEGVV